MSMPPFLSTLATLATLAELPRSMLAFAALAAALAPAGVASAKPSPSQTAKAGAVRVHRALVDCDFATFYSWPSRDSAPSPASYPPARMGDGFDVLGDAHVSYDGLVLYETTIDVVHPWGDGEHYWIAARCVNAA